MPHRRDKIYLFVVFFFIAGFAAFILNYALAWTNPTQVPPNGSGALYFSGGNVGIGVSPTAKLDIDGQIKIRGGSPGAGKILTSDASGLATWETPASGLPSGTSGQTLRYDGSAWVANSFLTNTGTRIGINTASPGGRLVVVGEGTTSATYALNVTNSGGTSILFVRDDGNIGIGTTAPDTKLRVAGGTIALDNNQPLQWRNAANTAYTSPLIVDTGNNLMLKPSSGLTGIFGSAGTEQWRFVDGVFQSIGTNTLYVNQGTGNVGIGTTSPAYKLDVASGGASTVRLGTASSDVVVIGGGAGKITVGTIDPLFNIGGKHYATYTAGLIGVKEEITNVVHLDKNEDNLYAYEIDFGKAEEGSDLWLFRQIGDFGENWDALRVLLTPNFSGRVWYKKIPQENRLIIYAAPEGETNLTPEVSYRLTAPRFDWSEWSNIPKETYRSDEGLKVPPKFGK